MDDRSRPAGQLSLFREDPAASPLRGEDRSLRSGSGADPLAQEHASARALSEKLPGSLRFGTSSWSFPGWAGIVYSRKRSASFLAREGLSEYARHPLLRTVGIDRSFYAPIPRADLERYASQLPPGFPACAKAPLSVTAAGQIEAGSNGAPRTGRTPNPDYLSAARFEDEMLGPFREAFAGHAGPFLLQFPPAAASVRGTPAAFADRLGRFLADLPSGFRYAVELRDPLLLTPEYRHALAATGVAHVYNCAAAMPMPEEQAAAVPVASAPFAVVRLLLRPGTTYDERRSDFVPFDRIVDPNPEMRRQVAGIVRAAAGRDVFVLVNNKAEGCAPATIRALAEELARR